MKPESSNYKSVRHEFSSLQNTDGKTFNTGLRQITALLKKIKDLLNEIKKHHSRELVNLNHSDTI